MKTENRNLEGIRQDLATRLVQREVVQCVSMLMSGIAAIAHHVPYKVMQEHLFTDADEMMGMFTRDDYEEAAREFIMEDADIDDLEAVADQYGEWSDVTNEHVATVYQVGANWGFTGCEADIYEDEDEAHEAAIAVALCVIRRGVWDLLFDDAYQEICSKYNLEPDQIEVYEHWVVSDWLARKLSGKGEITGDFAGLTIWGRCTTGQSISMDSVIQTIASELWTEEWAGEAA